MAASRHVKAKSKWKPVALPFDLLGDEKLAGLFSFEELSDYEIVTDEPSKGSEPRLPKNKKKKHKEKKNSERKAAVVRSSGNAQNSDSVPNIKKKSLTDGKVKKKKNEKQRAKTLQKTLKGKTLGDIIECGKVVDITDAKVPSEASEPENVGAEPARKTAKKRRKQTESVVSPSKKRKLIVKSWQQQEKPDDPMNDGKSGIKKDMSGWQNLFVPPEVLKALEEVGFSNPTPIQTETLPSAIRDRRDIIGAAETGSGKTLAFGIPLIHHILRLKRQMLKVRDEMVNDAQKEPLQDDRAGLDESGIAYSDEEASSDESESSDGDEDFVDDDDDDEQHSSDDNDVHDDQAEGRKSVIQRMLFALVLIPTRELAIQVKNHIQAVAKYTDIKVATVVGGMSQQKQERVLRKHPEIVVATPGRLWELIQEGAPHLQNIENVPLLVIDEADRMVEKGHFQELTNLFEMMNADEGKRHKRQNFVFSATLTFVHDAPTRLLLKSRKRKKIKKLSSTDKLSSLMAQIGMRERPKVADITRKVGTVETLTEARINCTMEEKDVYLYYFLKQFPGRTLIFVNSKDCLRRLTSILKLLQCGPLPLHSDMHQRQRLKNLDRFKGNPRGVLLATDVAARGLDIPDVQHVLHYQVPHTTENYIHRSGRTARAAKEGLSVMIIGPDDARNYKKIIKSLNRDKDLALFPIDDDSLPGIKRRVDLARNIDVEEHRKSKAEHRNSWFRKAAEEMDIELDEEDFLEDLGDDYQKAHQKVHLKQMKAELNALLRKPVIPKTFSGKYPTKSGKLLLPSVPASTEKTALLKVKKEILNDSQLNVSHSKQKKKKPKRKKFGKKTKSV